MRGRPRRANRGAGHITGGPDKKGRMPSKPAHAGNNAGKSSRPGAPEPSLQGLVVTAELESTDPGWKLVSQHQLLPLRVKPIVDGRPQDFTDLRDWLFVRMSREGVWEVEPVETKKE